MMSYEYSEGYDAYHDGVDFEDTPYPYQTYENYDWSKGWSDARSGYCGAL